jgi:hypothetical protein
LRDCLNSTQADAEGEHRDEAKGRKSWRASRTGVERAFLPSGGESGCVRAKSSFC